MLDTYFDQNAAFGWTVSHDFRRARPLQKLAGVIDNVVQNFIYSHVRADYGRHSISLRIENSCGATKVPISNAVNSRKNPGYAT